LSAGGGKVRSSASLWRQRVRQAGQASLRHFYACNVMPTRFGITWRTSVRSS
jgi:hypothetical protein